MPNFPNFQNRICVSESGTGSGKKVDRIRNTACQHSVNPTIQNLNMKRQRCDPMFFFLTVETKEVTARLLAWIQT